MSLPQDYINELNVLNKEVQRQQPQDILQFCSNYFLGRLEEQRKYQQSIEPNVKKTLGLSLFPAASARDDQQQPGSQGSGQGPLLFKQPFTNDDPHAKHFDDQDPSFISDNSSIGTKSVQPGIFKSGFEVGEENKSVINSTIDPVSSSTPSSNSKPAFFQSQSQQSQQSQDPQDPQQSTQSSTQTQQQQQQQHQSSASPSSSTSYNTNPNFASANAIAAAQARRSSTTVQIPSFQNHNIPSSFNANRRTSVSAETLNPHGIKDDFKPPIIPKTQDQLNRLSNSVVKNFLFSSLDEDSLKTVINALKEVKLPSGSEIIKQGDEGDFFYVVEDGLVEFYVNGQLVNVSGVGSSFGELALMYNSPRAATAIAKKDVVLWALDRLTFRRILLAKTSKKRQLYESFLKEVPVLKPLSSFERSKLADALDTETFKAGSEIIKEGEVGDNFYLIIKGEADVVKSNEGIVQHLKRGDYFGEVALLNDLPRQATIVASSDVDVATLDKRGFQRLLGPAVEVLKRQDPTKH